MSDNLPTQEELEQLSHALDEERIWKQSLSRPSDTELVAMFQKPKAIIMAKLKEWKEQKDNLEVSIREILADTEKRSPDEFTTWFIREIIKQTLVKDVLAAEGHICRLQRQLNIIKGHKPRDRITKEHIQQALRVPIKNIIPGPFRKSGKNLICLCPLHNERTPSFQIYTETNTGWCFGCGQGGNSIKLMRFLHNYSFVEAVKNLINLN